MAVSPWEQVVESSERKNEEKWSFIQGISFPPKPPPMNYYTVPYHIQGGPPRDLSAVGGAANTVDTGALRCKTTFLATGLMLVLLEHGESARSLPLQPPQWLKTDVQGSRPSVWKETVRLGFPGVKWKPAAGTTCWLYIWQWFMMLVFL